METGLNTDVDEKFVNSLLSDCVAVNLQQLRRQTDRGNIVCDQRCVFDIA